MSENDDRTPDGGRELSSVDRLAARMAEVSEAARSRPKQTKEDALRAMDDRREARRARRAHRRANPSGRAGRIARVAVVSVAGAGALMLVAGLGWSQTAFDQAQKANSAEIGSLKAEASALQRQLSDTDEAEAYAELVSGYYDSAVAAAKEAAALQNETAQLLVQAVAEPSPDNGVPAPSAMAALDLRKEAAELFSEKTRILADEDVYNYRSSVVMEEDEFDPRMPWFVKYDTQAVPSDPSTWEWRALSVMPSESRADRIDVTWTAMGDDGTVYAWAKATWDGAEETFIDFETTTTAIGDRHTPGKGLS